jgi:hypothetical protein
MITYGLLAFAFVFPIVGGFRIVEFKAAGISLRQRQFLIPLHMLGCLCFSGAMVLLAIDIAQEQKLVTQILFSAGILILFPMQIYVAIKRRIRFSK